MKKHIPNAFTLLNLISGFLAISFILHSKADSAIILIAAGFVFDILDGQAARLLKVTSKIGRELDSLADAVTFVVAPTFLVASKFQSQAYGLSVGAIIVACGVYRLAKFNIEGKTDYFSGMPTPVFAAMAILITSQKQLNQFFFALISLFIAFLMVSQIRFPSFKGKKVIKYKYRTMIIAGLSLLLYLLVRHLSITVLFLNIALIFMIFLPMTLSRSYPKKTYLYAFDAGFLVSLGIAYYIPLFTLMYAIMFSPLIELARGEK